MKKRQTFTSIIVSATIALLITGSQKDSTSPLPADEESAFLHLHEVMDKYHQSFDVYSDGDAGGNHFIPSGWMGDWGDITFDGTWSGNPHSGPTCMRITYSAQGSQGNNWAGIYWQDPENNWGDKPGGYDLTGATKLTFWARGEKGGEKIEFKIGGINRLPFDVYTEKNAPFNHYIPSGWYNGSSNMTFDDQWTDNPHSGATCIKVTWNGEGGNDGWKWNGVMWQNPEGNWKGDSGLGLDLQGATKLTFWARTDEPGLRLKFLVGYPDDSSGEVLIDEDGWVETATSWTKYEINLAGRDLSDVAGGFAFLFNDVNDPDPDGCTFYLDDIKYDKVGFYDPTKPYQDSFGPVTTGVVTLDSTWKKYTLAGQALTLSEEDLTHVIGGFLWVANKQGNPNGATFYLDDIRYDKARPGVLRFLVSYEATSDTEDQFIRNAAFIYDNAVAMLALMARGMGEDWKRADILGRSFIYAQSHDRYFHDGRLRNAYQSGDLADHLTGYARLPGWWDKGEKTWVEDRTHVGSSTGNLAWVMKALLRYYEVKGEPAYLAAAESLGTWIYTHCFDTRGPGGYSGGYDGWEPNQTKLQWKSTEHNLDVYVAFTKLYQVTGNHDWQDRALHARNFVEAMWDSSAGHFWTGTDTDGITINKSVRPLDVNPLGLMALQDVGKYGRGISWAEDSCSVTEACGVECSELSGFDFNTDRDGIWWEGTAQMVVALRMKGENTKADFYLDQLRRVQTCAPHNNGKGIVAACHDSLSTGFDSYYFNRLHVAATSWYIFAEGTYNPFWSTVVPVELNSFEAFVEDNSVILRWSTATESNNYGFEVERSKDKVNFTKVAFLQGRGTVAIPQGYTFQDRDLQVGRYFYRLKQIDTDGSFEYSGIVEAVVGIPKTFELSQNYPNPFNPATTIKYQLPEPSEITLKVYNVLGQMVKTLVDEKQMAGYYSIRWDGKNDNGRPVASGVYLYRLTAGEFVQVRKMILVR